MKHHIRLIALDLDGTLLDNDKRLPARNLEALHAAAEQGVLVVPATGRYLKGMPEPIKSLPFLEYAITINGARVLNARTGEILYEGNMPLDTAVAIMDTLDPLPVIYDCYQDDWGYVTESLQKRAAEFTDLPHALKMLRELRTPVPELREWLRQRGKPVQKVQFYTKDMELRRWALDNFDALFPGTVVTSSWPGNVEINAVAGNKGDALLALAKHLGIPREEVAALGDGTNDISMLRAAGLGIAMGNASEEVKIAADLVTGSNEETGAADAIEKLLREEL